MSSHARFLVLFVLCCSTPIAFAQASASLTAAEQHDVISSLVEQIEELYVFPDSVDRVRTFLLEREENGAYDELTTPASFGQQLTMDLRGFTNDRHFGVSYDPERFREMEAMFAQQDDGSGRRARGGIQLDPASPMALRYRTANYYFRTAEVLDGNVGYLKIDQMPPLSLAKPTVDAAMAFLAHTDAMIIDLRGTPGGVGGFIPYLISYFFPPEPQLLYVRDFGAADSSATFYTHETIGGARRPSVPLYILTDGFTGSAAENLAYTLQQHGRATVIGDVTAGAAHSAGGTVLVHGFLANIPMARVIHPLSQTNWERVGVQPDVPTTSEQALPTAHGLALDEILSRTDNQARRQEIERVRRRLVEQPAPVSGETATDAEYHEYAGSYGVRNIFVENGELKLQRDGGPALTLRRVEEDQFVFELPPGMRSAQLLPDVHFRRDESGSVVGFTFIRADGSIEEEVDRDQ